jgi:putative copper resistance protein D
LKDPLIWIRAIHFAAMLSVAGTVFFVAFVADPICGVPNKNSQFAVRVRTNLSWTTWVSLLVGIISGAGWLILLAARLSGQKIPAVLTGGPLWTVLSQTDFGKVWVVRLFLSGLLAGALILAATMRRPHTRVSSGLTVVLAASLIGTLSWAGHAAANMDSDFKGSVHLIGDSFHLIAAAAWVGALLPLAILLNATIQKHSTHSLAVARAAILRFSTLGMISVATVLITGIYNSWMLAGSVGGLLYSDYGHLLLIKVALFFVMLCVAAANRLQLTPLLMGSTISSAQDAALRLRRNAVIEAAIGVVIIMIVATLGTMNPSLEEDAFANVKQVHVSGL